MTAQDQCCVATATLALQVHGSTCVYGDALLASFFLPPASLVNMQPSGTEQFLKDLMEQREQKKIEKGGEKAGVGKFRHAALDENKSLHMKATTTGMPPSSLSPPPPPPLFPQPPSIPPLPSPSPPSPLLPPPLLNSFLIIYCICRHYC